jgi:phosphatidylinositol alpha-1,6-mannosyltransferase
MGGGISRWMGELARRFPPGGLVVSTGQHGESERTDESFPNLIDRLPIPSIRLRTVQGIVLWSRRAVALARRHRTEFVWCGNVKPAAYPAHWAHTRTGIPYGVLLHGGDLLILQQQVERSRLKRRAARMLLQGAALLVTNSRWTADLCHSVLEQTGLRSRSDRVHTIRLGTDPLRFRPGVSQTEIRSRYDLQGRRWLLSVARLTRHKGIDAGIMALASLAKEYPDLGYLVVGSGEELAGLKQLAADLTIADRVRFLTNVSDQELPALYNCAEIYLGLSRLMSQRVEGFGISLLEAGACGIPVVASRVGGIPDAVLHGESGLLVESDHQEQVCAAVRTLLRDPSLARQLGQGGRKAVERFYNWNRVAEEIERLGQEFGTPQMGLVPRP